MDITIVVEYYAEYSKIFYWCVEHCTGKWAHIDTFAKESYYWQPGTSSYGFLFTFEDESDLMFFRLVWGGEIRHRMKQSKS